MKFSTKILLHIPTKHNFDKHKTKIYTYIKYYLYKNYKIFTQYSYPITTIKQLSQFLSFCVCETIATVIFPAIIVDTNKKIKT